MQTGLFELKITRKSHRISTKGKPLLTLIIICVCVYGRERKRDSNMSLSDFLPRRGGGGCPLTSSECSPISGGCDRNMTEI